MAYTQTVPPLRLSGVHETFQPALRVIVVGNDKPEKLAGVVTVPENAGTLMPTPDTDSVSPAAQKRLGTCVELVFG